MKRLFIAGAACIVFFTSMIAVNAKKSTPQKSNEQITVGTDADYAKFFAVCRRYPSKFSET